MLKSLTVWNFALLEHVQVEFEPGLNILTGETGAGKSILIDSLGAVLGARMSADMVRSGCDWLRVEAVFSLEDESLGLHELLTQQAIDDADKELIITRQLTRAGRSTALVNGCHVTLAVLRQIGAYLVDIHGQNENLALLKEENQFHLLDGYDPDVSEALAAYECVYREWREKKKAYAEKQQASREYAQRLDMLHWQDKEISEANLKPGEDEQLEADIRKLSHAEKIVGSVEESYQLLEGGSGNGLGVLPALSQVKKDLEEIGRFDDALANAQKMVEEAYISLQEASYELRDYGESVEFSPERLDQLQSRMDVIYRLCKKYGATLEDVLAHQAKVEQELTEIENYDEDIAALEKEIAALEEKLGQKADALTKLRTAAAQDLSSAIEEQLFALGMPRRDSISASSRPRTTARTAATTSRCSSRPTRARRRSPCRRSPRAASSRASRSPSRRSPRRATRPCRAWSSTRLTRALAAARPRWSRSASRSSRSTNRCSASRICRRSPAWPTRISTSRSARSRARRRRRSARSPSASASARSRAWRRAPT